MVRVTCAAPRLKNILTVGHLVSYADDHQVRVLVERRKVQAVAQRSRAA